VSQIVSKNEDQQEDMGIDRTTEIETVDSADTSGSVLRSHDLRILSNPNEKAAATVPAAEREPTDIATAMRLGDDLRDSYLRT